MFSLSTFEHQLVMYVTANDKATFSTAFNMTTVPVVSHEQALAEERTKKLTSATPTIKAPSTGPKKPQTNGTAESPAAAALAAAQKHAQALQQIPEIKALGNVLHSSQPVELTESETEYPVTVIKHIFSDHLVLQYEVKNNVAETVLENLSVVATPSEDDEEQPLEEDFIIPVEKLTPDQPGKYFFRPKTCPLALVCVFPRIVPPTLAPSEEMSSVVFHSQAPLRSRHSTDVS